MPDPTNNPTPNADIVKLQADMVEVSGKVTSLSAELTTSNAENAKLRKELSEQKANVEVDGLVRAGKAVPAMKAKLVELYMKDPLMFTELTATMPVIVEAGRIHGTGAGDQDANNEIIGDAIKLFDDEVVKYEEAHPNTKRSDAMSAVARLKPGLYEARRAQFSRETAVNGSPSVN
jgi:hypothetical protein